MQKRILRTLKGIPILCILLLSMGTSNAQNSSQIDNGHTVIRFDFSKLNGDKVVDISANGFEATLYNSAKVVTIGTKETGIYNVLDLGSMHGLMNMSEDAGTKFCQLNDFSVSAFIRIDDSYEMNDAGSPLFSFTNSLYANSANNGIITLTLANLGYEITPTNRNDVAHSSTKLNHELFKGEWHHVLYTQAGTSGKIYLDGNLITSGTVPTVPADLFTKYEKGTMYNFIGHSGISTEKYLERSLIYDFLVTDYAFSDEEISGSELAIPERIKALNSAITAYRGTSKTAETNTTASANKGKPSGIMVYSGSEAVLNAELTTLDKVTFTTSNTTFNWADASTSVVQNSEVSKIVFTDYKTSARKITKQLSTLQVYPNPANESIELKNAENRVFIYSLSGSIIKSINAKTSIKNIDISDLKEGMYIIKSGNESKRLIKN